MLEAHSKGFDVDTELGSGLRSSREDEGGMVDVLKSKVAHECGEATSRLGACEKDRHHGYFTFTIQLFTGMIAPSPFEFDSTYTPPRI